MTPELAFLLNQAFQHFQNGRIDNAGELLSKALKIQSRNFDALHLLGVIKGMQGKHEEAKTLLKKAIQINPGNGFVHFNLAKALSEIGRDAEALTHHKKASQLLPDDPTVWLNYGKSLGLLNQTDEALACYEKALALHPNYAEALTNRGWALHQLQRHEESLSSLHRALTLNPNLATAWYYQGNVLLELNRFDGALHNYEKALAIKPDYVEAHNHRGVVLCEKQWFDEALVSFDRAIAIKSDYPNAHLNRGHALKDMKQFESALASYDHALAFKPDTNFCHGLRLHVKMMICDWTNFDKEVNDLLAVMAHQGIVSAPFSLLPLSISPIQQKKGAEVYVQNQCPPILPSTFIPSSTPSQKIRIGYFSTDFRNHPIGHLAVGLFEGHDRAQFEVYGFGLLPPDNSPLGERLAKAFDHFIDLSPMGLPESIETVRKLELDIGVDLNGHTQNSRTKLFSHRIASVQVNYLGYPGTMGAEFMDYMVADSAVIPEESSEFYTEKIAWLPNSFMVNSYPNNAAQAATTRQVEGLPEDRFVFCCFNNNYKITPAIFDLWMSILLRTEDSVLLLYVNTDAAARNLKKEAQLRGVDVNRLIFASSVDRDRYFARYRVVDLYLDTLPYNAGTTACDALWAGLPVLTLAGPGFQSRMAASLLTAIGLPEMITFTPEEYGNLAVAMATQPEKLAAVKEKLARNRLTQPLFDTALTTRHLEEAYRQMHERRRQQLPPDHIHVTA